MYFILYNFVLALKLYRYTISRIVGAYVKRVNKEYFKKSFVNYDRCLWYVGIIMKYIKWLLSIILFFIAFFLAGEVYQRYLGSFYQGLYYVFSTININRSTYDSTRDFCETLQEIANEEKIYAFAIVRQIDAFDDCTCDIYGSEGCIQILASQYDIYEGTFASTFSGTTTIAIHDFTEWYTVANEIEFPSYYLIGDEDSIKAASQRLSSMNANASSLRHNSEFNISILIYAVWMVVLLFLLLLTWFDIQFNKKKNFLKISLGRSMNRIIFESILVDIVVFGGVFLISFVLTGRLTYNRFVLSGQILIFAGFLFINSILYFSLRRHSYKEILYGANINQSLFINCYALKALSSVIIIFVFSFSFIFIDQNAYYLQVEDRLLALEDYYFVDPEIRSKKTDNEELAQQQEILEALIADEQWQGHVALAVSLEYYIPLGAMYLANIEDTRMVDINENNGYEDKDTNDVNPDVDKEGSPITATKTQSNDITVQNNDISMKGEQTRGNFEIIDIKSDKNVCQILLYNTICKDFITVNLFEDIIKDEECDFYFFIPAFKNEVVNSLANPEEVLYEMVYKYYGLGEGTYSVSINYYDQSRELFYFNTFSKYGFESADNPMIIYCARTDEELSVIGAKPGIILTGGLSNLPNDELDTLSSYYGLRGIKKADLKSICETSINTIKRTILLDVIACVIVLVLELLLLLVIIKLEYMVNAKTLAVKKFLGYTLLERNKILILLNVIALTGAVAINMLFAVIHKQFLWWHPTACGVLLILFEIFLMLLDLRKQESLSIIKILKGCM